MRTAGLLLALLPWALPAAGADPPLASLQAATQTCAQALAGERHAEAAAECSELLALLETSGWDQLVGDQPLVQVAVLDLGDHLAFLGRTADRSAVDPGLLPELQARLAAEANADTRSWLERLRDWIQARIGGGTDTSFSLPGWIAEWLEELARMWSLSPAAVDLLTTALQLIMLLALGLVAFAVWRWSRTWARTSPPRGRDNRPDDELPASAPSLDALRAAPIDDQPGLLFALLVDALHRHGLLPDPRALTWRETLERADPGVDRGLLAASGECAEQATFGHRSPAAGEFSQLLERCVALIRGLRKPGAQP